MIINEYVVCIKYLLFTISCNKIKCKNVPIPVQKILTNEIKISKN